MAYTEPTLSAFRTKYPTFAAVADETVQAWLDEGDGETAAWPDPDRARAVMLYAAHKLSESGAATGGQSLSGVTSFKSGTFQANVSDTVAQRTGFDATIYGREYLLLQRRNFTGLFSAWDAPIHCPGEIPTCDV